MLYKFGHLPQKDWQTMYDLAKMFLHCLNHWKLEPPAARRQVMSQDEISAYKVSPITSLSSSGSKEQTQIVREQK